METSKFEVEYDHKYEVNRNHKILLEGVKGSKQKKYVIFFTCI